MKLLEKILAVIAIIALVMKFFFIPGNSILLIVSTMTIAMIYYPLGFAFFNGIRLRQIFKKASYQGVSGKRIFGAIGAGMALSVLCVGVLFDIQNYPGASMDELVGLFLGGAVLITVVVMYFQRRDIYYKRIAIRLIIGLLIIFPIYFIPELEFVKIQYRNYPDYIEAYEEYSSSPYSDSLSDQLWSEYDKVIESETGFSEPIEEDQ